jgi:hypothetical protein
MRCECEATEVGRSKLEVEHTKFGILGVSVQRSTSNFQDLTRGESRLFKPLMNADDGIQFGWYSFAKRMVALISQLRSSGSKFGRIIFSPRSSRIRTFFWIAYMDSFNSEVQSATSRNLRAT